MTDDLRRRRHVAALDSDPLIAFQQERDRLQTEIDRLQGTLTGTIARHQNELVALKSELAKAKAESAERFKQLTEAKQKAASGYTNVERQLATVRDALRGEPEYSQGTSDIAAIAAMAFPRMRKERDMAMEKSGTLMALMERIDQFLVLAEKMRDQADDLQSMRDEAATLHTEIVKIQVSAPFIQVLVQATQEAWRLVKVLDTNGAPQWARTTIDRLRRAIDEIPPAMLGIQPKGTTVKAEADRARQAIAKQNQPALTQEWKDYQKTQVGNGTIASTTGIITSNGTITDAGKVKRGKAKPGKSPGAAEIAAIEAELDAEEEKMAEAYKKALAVPEVQIKIKNPDGPETWQELRDTIKRANGSNSLVLPAGANEVTVLRVGDVAGMPVVESQAMPPNSIGFYGDVGSAAWGAELLDLQDQAKATWQPVDSASRDSAIMGYSVVATERDANGRIYYKDSNGTRYRRNLDGSIEAYEPPF